MLEAIRRLGITHVLFDRKALAAGGEVATLAISSATTRDCCLVPFYEDENTSVYEVRYSPLSETGSSPGLVEHGGWRLRLLETKNP